MTTVVVVSPLAATRTFLQLCQELRAQSGLSGTGPATVVGQTGMYERMVTWVQQAYAEILRMHPWDFLWARAITDTGLAVSDLGRIYADKVFDTTSTPNRRIPYLPWDQLDSLDTTTTGAPQYFSRRPDKAIVFWPTLDAVYPLRLDYLRDGHQLLDNADVPLIPDGQLHPIIVCKALDYYGMYNEDQAASLNGGRQFNMMLSQMHAQYGRQLLTAPISIDQEFNPNVVELV